MKGFKDSNNKFLPITQSKGVRKSRDQNAKLQGVRMKRYNVCEAFLEDPATHRGDEPDHTNQVMYSLGDENCASVLTDEEFSMLLTDDQVANTFNPIGETATKWQEDKAFRSKIIDRSLELIEEQKSRKKRYAKAVISDQQTFEDFWQEMGERGAVFEVLMEADLSANQAVIGTIDEGTDMDSWHIPPLVVGKVAQRKIIASRGGIDEMKEFLAYNADWDQYKEELEREN